MQIRLANAVAAVCLLFAASPAVTAEPDPGTSRTTADTVTVGQVKPPKSSRLRFKSAGPACMCVSGMSEAEIADAERRRRDSAANLDKIKQDP